MIAVSGSRPGATTRLSTIRTTTDRDDHALPAARGGMSPAVRDAMLAAVPGLRAFAISLSGNVDRADDLLQEALLRAIAAIGSFQPGTNMSAWLVAILRNLFYSEYRKRRREVEDSDGRYVNSLKSAPEQQSRVEFEEFRVALAMLPTSQREALLLVGASGFSCDEAAAICKCAAGTIKSRVHRARTSLSKLLAIDGTDQFGQDPTMRGVLTAGRHG
jgi:RNA polymerase sigma-70 factor (ECF subfamily)